MTASFGAPIRTVPVAGSSRESDDLKMGVLVQNLQEDSSFSQWITAMKMVVQLPGGIPSDFRSRLWLSLADRYLTQRGVYWKQVEKVCFNDAPQPDDTVLGNQIIKDLHRTGCNLFCGEAGKENQVLLKRVLLAYARWNKDVGYCQGFNMLAALILQVTNKCEQDALKVMIYLVEGVLPDSYFANNLRGLSVDMAVFRDLMHLKLPKLSQHLERLQNSTKDGNKSYEPPLTNVFTIQWFLTLFCNCLSQPTVLRIWDLIFLEGNEILLKTALCIWKIVSDKILEVQSADEFYGTMSELTKRLLTSNFISANALVGAIVTIGPLNGLDNLRKQYLYSISNKCNQTERKVQHRQTIPLDISVLKKQYSKIKQRQKQAHVIFFSALSRQQRQTTPEAINHLLVMKTNLNQPGKNQSFRSNPQPDSIKHISPKIKNSSQSKQNKICKENSTIPPLSMDTLNWREKSKENFSSSSSSTDTELCDEDIKELSDNEEDILKLANSSPNAKFDNTSASNIVQSLDSNHLSSLKDIEPKTFQENLIILDKDFDENPENCDTEAMVNLRRNSINAFKIMQENSMILHRIMNCQNRTPSPPSISESVNVLDINLHSPTTTSEEKDTSFSPSASGHIDMSNCDNMSVSNAALQHSPTSPSSFCSENLDFLTDTTVPFICSRENLLSPYKYRNLLFEISLSLDEKYNDLFSNKSLCPTRPQDCLHESKSESFIPDISTLAESLGPSESSNPETLSLIPDTNQNDQCSEQTEEKAIFKLTKENVELLDSCAVGDRKSEYITYNPLFCDKGEISILKKPLVFGESSSIQEDLLSNSIRNDEFNKDTIFFINKTASLIEHFQNREEAENRALYKVSNENEKVLKLDTLNDEKSAENIPNEIFCDKSKTNMLEEPLLFSGSSSFEEKICDTMFHDFEPSISPSSEKTIDIETVIEKSSRELIEENVRVLDLVLNRKKPA